VRDDEHTALEALQRLDERRERLAIEVVCCYSSSSVTFHAVNR
jgi:hypothetical protein